MFVLMGLAWAWHPIAGVIVGPLAYLGALAALKAIGPEEKRVLDRLRGSRGAEESERAEEAATSTI
jgi:hypothetical protein